MTHPEIEPVTRRLLAARSKYQAAPFNSHEREVAWEELRAASEAHSKKRTELIRSLGLEPL